MRLAPVLVALLGLGATAACGADAGAPAAAPVPAAAPSVQGVPEGTPVPEVLSRFRCERGDDEVWRAAGMVRNPTKEPVTYQVTVQVGPPGGESPAATQPVGTVKAGGKASFRIEDIPASGGADSPCHVQVLALP